MGEIDGQPPFQSCGEGLSTCYEFSDQHCKADIREDNTKTYDVVTTLNTTENSSLHVVWESGRVKQKNLIKSVF